MNLFGFSLANIFGKPTTRQTMRRTKHGRSKKHKTRNKKGTRKYKMRGG